MRKIVLLNLLLIITSSVLFSQGYEISVTIKGAENKEIILGHHKNDKLIPVDTVKTNRSGHGVFKKKEKLQQGMYFIFLNETYFDILIGDEQKFSISTDTSDLNNIKVKGSEELKVFADYHKFLMEQNMRISEIRDEYAKETDEAKKAKLEDEMKKITGKFEDYYQKILKDYPNIFFTTFLKATRDVEIPETITDNNEKYFYYKAHYFDNFDISDKRLFFTNIYESKVDTYIDKIVIQNPDSLKVAVDYLLSKTKNDFDLYQYMLIHLFNKYASSNYMIAENMYVYIGEIYTRDASWSTDSFKNETKTKIIRKKNCLIGNVAKPLKMYVLPSDSTALDDLRIPLEIMKENGLEIEKDKSRTFDEKLPDLSRLIAEYETFFPAERTLKNSKAKYTLLLFMSPDCSHCKKEVPALFKSYVNELKSKDVEVWSIYLEKNTDNWTKFSDNINLWFDFIMKHKMFAEGWYNVWNPFDNYRFKYDINSSPILYLLDKDKKIIAKRIGHEQAIEVIKSIEERENKK